MAAPPPPVCAMEVVLGSCACVKAELSLAWLSLAWLSLGWTVTTAVDEGTVTVIAPPLCTAAALEVASDASDCTEARLSLGWTVTIAVDDGTVTVTMPPLRAALEVAWIVELDALIDVASSLAAEANKDELLAGMYALAVLLVEAEMVVVSAGVVDGIEASRDEDAEAAWFRAAEEVACSAVTY